MRPYWRINLRYRLFIAMSLTFSFAFTYKLHQKPAHIIIEFFSSLVYNLKSVRNINIDVFAVLVHYIIKKKI